jgi:hypothetical protein
MPYDEPELDDPTMLVAVELPAGPESMREMAAAFADEFAALGFDETRLLALFRHPQYAGAHLAYCCLGEGAIRELIRESVGFWSRVRFSVRDAEDFPQVDPRSIPGAQPLVQLETVGELEEEKPCKK